jgi:hypothetical protein
MKPSRDQHRLALQLQILTLASKLASLAASPIKGEADAVRLARSAMLG